MIGEVKEEQVKGKKIVKQIIIIYTPTLESKSCKSLPIFTFDSRMGMGNCFVQIFPRNIHMFRKVFLLHNTKQYPYVWKGVFFT
jgi:hypothetical protein